MWSAWAMLACSTDLEQNLADCETGRAKSACSEKTRDEKARLAIDDERFDEAVLLLEELVAEEPLLYQRYPLLAAVYARRAGLNLFDLLKAELGSGTSLMEIFSQFLPTPAKVGEAQYPAYVAEMLKAMQILERIPGQLIEEASEEEYASSARLQLFLYRTSYSVMYLNQFASAIASDQFDPQKLQNLTEEDAVIILRTLAAASATAANAETSAKINEVLAEVQASDGGTSKEKLQNYLNRNDVPAAP